MVWLRAKGAQKAIGVHLRSLIHASVPLWFKATYSRSQRERRSAMTTHYDTIVIGTGQSGPPLASRMADEGLKTAVIERKRFGGTCVNTGCVPTKTLVASARAAYVARRAADFGVRIKGGVKVDMRKVKARKDEIVDKGTKGIAKWMRTTDNVT